MSLSKSKCWYSKIVYIFEYVWVGKMASRQNVAATKKFQTFPYKIFFSGWANQNWSLKPSSNSREFLIILSAHSSCLLLEDLLQALF